MNRDEAIDKVWYEWNQVYHPGEKNVPAIERAAIVTGYIAGFAAGAASVSRKEIVEEAFQRVKDQVGHQAPYGKDRWGYGISEVVQAMDAYLAEMENEK
jgi:hypothetical protein